MSKAAALMLTGAALAVTVYQILILGPQLPEQVASHFGAGGVGDGFGSRKSFLILIGALQIGLAAMHVGISQMIGKLPPSMVNMPNSEYWLSPERREQSVAFMQTVIYWIGALTAALLAFVFQLSIKANLLEPPRLPMGVFGVAMVVYMIAVTWACLRMVLRFRDVPSDHDPTSAAPINPV